jgi:hypothetical protein
MAPVSETMADYKAVDYQFVQMVYFDDDTSLPRASDYAAIWLGYSKLQEQRVSGFFSPCHDKGRIKSKRLRLGHPTSVDALLRNPEAVFSGMSAAGSIDSTHYHHFNLSIETAGHCVFGPTPPSFKFTIRNSWVTDLLGVPAFLKILHDNFEILDRSQPFYGFVDLDRTEDIYNGYPYGSIEIANAPMDRSVDQARWLRSVNLKRHQARSVYWGNYFGNVILDKVGGREAFLSYYREKTTSRHGTPTVLIWEFTNGVFVSLSEDTSDCVPGGLVSTLVKWNIKWLYDRLAEGHAIVGA